MKLLFICTHNACRSILAESIARKMGGNLWQAASAGSHPAGTVHPSTLSALAKDGYSTSDLVSESWDELEHYAPDIVITVCDQAAGEVCPVWFGKALKAHWGLPDPSKIQDPAGQGRMFEEVIKTLENRLTALAESVRINNDVAVLHKQIEMLGKV